FGRVTQTLTRHGYTGKYYPISNVPVSPRCPCRIHIILRKCPRYNRDRYILIQSIPDVTDPAWKVPLLVGPKRALPAFAHFSRKSGAF
ncbi:hypothetical protein BDM02DRAFT_3081030, partial [Thelephora ganbajun]